MMKHKQKQLTKAYRQTMTILPALILGTISRGNPSLPTIRAFSNISSDCAIAQ